MRKYNKHNIPKFLQDFIENPEAYLIMKNISPFSLSQLGQIWTKYINVSKKYSNLLILDKISSNFNDLLIIGDTHGDFSSTLRIIKPFLDGKVDSILFLGDYVDRGDFSFLNIIFLISISIVWPDRVILLRGNHEDLEINLIYGFYKELQTYFPIYHEFQAVLAIMDALYNLMSLVAITPKNSVCMHAGIPKNMPNLDVIDQIPKPHKEYHNLTDRKLKKKLDNAFIQVRWNDPIEKKLKKNNEKSYHGYYYYTLEEVQNFLSINKQKRIIKSHEDIRGGYQEVFSKQLYHIFSSEPYFGQIQKAYTIHEQNDGEIVVRDLDFNLQFSL